MVDGYWREYWWQESFARSSSHDCTVLQRRYNMGRSKGSVGNIIDAMCVVETINAKQDLAIHTPTQGRDSRLELQYNLS